MFIVKIMLNVITYLVNALGHDVMENYTFRKIHFIRLFSILEVIDLLSNI